MTTPSSAGAFVQLNEYRTDHPEQIETIVKRWTQAIGADRTARWYLTTADRDQPGRFIQLVEFPSYEEAMKDSEHDATAEFARALSDLAADSVVFRNLEIVAAHAF